MGRTWILALAALGSVGCTTLQTQQRAESDARMAMTLQGMSARIQQLEAQIDNTVAAREDIYRRLDDVQAGVDAQGRRSADRINDLETRVDAEAVQREALGKTLVDQLTREVTAIVKAHTPAQTSESGYKHTVRSGETLSAIAQAYGTSVPAIKKANRLKSDRIRVDQKLFIPE
jgi:LysM repeat protein